MSDLATLVQQVIEQNQQLLGVLETLAAAEATKAQAEVIMAQLDLEAHVDHWVDAATLSRQLGPAFPRSRILADLGNGLFKFGRDYILTTKTRDPWAFKKSRVEAVYLLPPEKRRQWPVVASIGQEVA